jgi:prepilin-type N-terminal cleavage/methylation domain-containing protein
MPEPLTAPGALDNGVEMDMKMRRESGFSLIEMIVAVAVTLVVTGAVYGLIAGGNNAFRREPELAERQQNARMAMDLIIRDIQTTGSGLPAFIQAFARGLDSCSATGVSPAGTARTCPVAGTTGTTAFNAGILSGGAADRPDDIEMIGNPGNQDGEQTCHYGGGSAANVRMRFGNTNIQSPEVVLVLLANGTYAVVNINSTTDNKNGAGDCVAGTPHMQLNWNKGGDPTGLNQPGGICAGGVTGTAANSNPCNPVMVARGEIIRYGIRRDADGVPNLYRFSTGTLTSGVTTWQVVAKGIEDLQVQYRHLDPATMNPVTNWLNEPPQVAGCDPANPLADCCDPGCIEPSCRNRPACVQPNNAALARLVTEVRVTLTARSEAQNMQGVSASQAGGTRVRGSLTQTVAPRATLFAMSRRPMANGGPVWR